MRHLVLTLTTLAALGFSQLTPAATVPKSFLDTNTQFCSQIADAPASQRKLIDPYSPNDAKKVPAYCSCVSQKYWGSVPQADFDGFIQETQSGNPNGKHGLSIQKFLNARLEAAQKTCAM